jgi:hypothetical protein
LLLAFSAFIQLNLSAPSEGENESSIIRTVEFFDLKLIDKFDEDRYGVEMEIEGKEHFHKTKNGLMFIINHLFFHLIFNLTTW